MGVADDIRAKAKDTFKSEWSTRKGTVVPEPEDLALSNDAVHLETAAILYADLDQSTALVEEKSGGLPQKSISRFCMPLRV